MIILRPLLTILNLAQIRYLILAVLIIFALISLFLIVKKINIPTAIIFLLGMFIVDYFYMWQSLQGAPVFLICMILSLILLSEKLEKYTDIVFLVTGGITAFFDFLTAPVITLGVPLIIYVLLEQRKEEKLKTILIHILKLSVLWGIGYAGVMASKWIIIDLVYHKGIMSSAMDQFFYRANNIQVTPIDAIIHIFQIVKLPALISVIVVIFMIAYKIIRNGKKLKFNLTKIIPYIVVGMIGILWYVVLKSHSAMHRYFTYRTFFSISICALLTIYEVLGVEHKKEENTNELYKGKE